MKFSDQLQFILVGLISSFFKCHGQSHPLDQLNPQEIVKTKEIINKQHGPNFLYNTIALREPPKASLLKYFLSGSQIPRSVYERKSHSVLVEKGETGIIYEAVVNLDTSKLESFVKQPEGTNVAITPDDSDLAKKIIRNDSAVEARCKSLGLEMHQVYPAIWSISYIDDLPEYSHAIRPFAGLMFVIMEPGGNHYAHPMDFIVVVDVALGRVLGIEDVPTHEESDKGKNKKGNSLPRIISNYDYRMRAPNFLRKDQKPLKVTMPEGPSFHMNGNELSWQKFKMHISFNPREGIFLNHITYNDSGIVRPIMYRASVAETAVFYGDPRPPHHRKVAMDQAEMGLGYRINELQDQVDCLGATKFIDVVLHNNDGDPVVKKGGICINEEDTGILWKHTDSLGHASVVRSRRLSIMMTICTGNYDFIFKWHFYQDASIEFQVQLTGIPNVNMLAINSTSAGYGSIVLPQVSAMYHQHLLALRLDTEIDGNQNSIFESDKVMIEKGEQNPFGQGFTLKNTYLKTQKEGRRSLNPLAGRVWIITNPNKHHPYTKEPVGWKLIPSTEPQLMIRKDSPVHPKMSYADNDLWVTKYVEDQLYPGGFYMTFKNSNGLPQWVAKDPDASIENQDIVVWHMFNPIHIPRVEEFPTMPAENRQVFFRPCNFFMENAALDVPPPNVKKHTEL